MTAQEAIKIIKCAKAEVEWNYPLDYTVAFETIIKVLEEQDKHRWIPVSESQPPETDNYLATVESSDGTAVITFVNVEHHNSGNDWTGCFKGKKNRREVIAWMPLPASYKKGVGE